MSGQPPVPPPPSPQGAPSQGGLESNVAAALAYLPILAIVWLLVEPYSKDRFIRFHSVQSLGLAVVSMGVYIVLGVIPVLGWILLLFAPLAFFVIWVICAVKAFQKETFKLPLIGDFAEKQAATV
jgi:uncharacterized membrane protein